MMNTTTSPLSTFERIHALHTLVGNTPLLQLEFEYNGERRNVFAKAENLNMTGSIKDRMALFILEQAARLGLLSEGDIIAEATSGNTGISFAAIGCALGHRVKIYMPDWMSLERKALIRSFGAEIEEVTAEEGGFLGSIERAEEFGKQPNVFLPRQFANEANVQTHATGTGPEIWTQLASQQIRPDAFVAGVGTGGTVMGVGRFLKMRNEKIRVHPLEPSNSPTLSTGHRVGKHRIQGISDEFIPPIVELRELDDVVSVDDGDAILMAQKLARQVGLGVGISSGANFLGALEVQDEMGSDAIVVTVFPDSNKKYLSTDLLNHQELQPGFVTPYVTLIGFRTLGRACQFCLDPVSGVS